MADSLCRGAGEAINDTRAFPHTKYWPPCCQAIYAFNVREKKYTRVSKGALKLHWCLRSSFALIKECGCMPRHFVAFSISLNGVAAHARWRCLVKNYLEVGNENAWFNMDAWSVSCHICKVLLREVNVLCHHSCRLANDVAITWRKQRGTIYTQIVSAMHLRTNSLA